MLQPDFSDYVNNICKNISSRQKREDVAEELFCHLEDNYERNLAVGMSEEEARQDAISKMGDSTTLAYRLANIHSYSPLTAMSSAFVALICGYILMNFIFLSGFVKDIIHSIGIIIVFSSLLRMRRVNGEVNKAFHLFNFYVLSRLFFYAVSLGQILPLWISSTSYILNALFSGLFYLFLFKGLDSLVKPHLTEESKKPKLIFCGVYQLLLCFFNGFMLVLSEGESITITAFILPIFMLFMFFYTIVQLVRVRRILWDADNEYNILPSDKKHLLTFVGVLFGCFALVLTFNYVSATRAPVKTELIIHDLSEKEQKEADKIREKMLSWDVHPQIVEDLPDSEILNYKDAEFVTWGADGGSMGGSQELTGATSDIYYYWFFIPDKRYEGSYDVRLLYYIESHYADSVKGIYRKGFYYAPWGKGIMPLNQEDILNGSYIGIITDENGKKYNAEPFFTHKLTDDYITNYPKGFEYREEKGQRVYYATQIGVGNLDDTVGIFAATVRNRWFSSFGYNTTADFIETILQTNRITSPSGKYIPFYWRLHTVATGNFDYEKLDEYKDKAHEYEGYYPKD